MRRAHRRNRASMNCFRASILAACGRWVPTARHEPPGVSMQFLVGALALLLLVVNTLIWCTVLFMLALVKLLLPAGMRGPLDKALNWVATRWIACNCGWMRLTQSTDWDVDGAESLAPDGWYLVSCNHQSWVDIFVLQRVLNRRIPLLKFFLKHELLYVPVMGLAWWALDFPFMRRHSRQALRDKPSRRTQDVDTGRRACAKFAQVPTSVMNFVEGTRFTPRKHAAQGSPYRHLLKPKTGALAASLETLGPKFTAMLDVTIVYPGGTPSFWDFLCGRVSKIVVRCRQVPLPNELRLEGQEMDAAVRSQLARWLAKLWAEKDAQIEALLGGAREAPITCSASNA